MYPDPSENFENKGQRSNFDTNTVKVRLIFVIKVMIFLENLLTLDLNILVNGIVMMLHIDYLNIVVTQKVTLKPSPCPFQSAFFYFIYSFWNERERGRGGRKR